MRSYDEAKQQVIVADGDVTGQNSSWRRKTVNPTRWTWGQSAAVVGDGALT